MTLDTPTVAWASVAIASAVIEILTPQFGMIFASAGAVAAVLVTLLGGGVVWQLLVFAVVLVASLSLLRPRMLAWFGHAPGVPSRTASLVGKRALVTQAVNPTLGTGRVTVAGEDWAARSAGAIDVGADVQIVGADGIVLEVERI